MRRRTLKRLLRRRDTPGRQPFSHSGSLSIPDHNPDPRWSEIYKAGIWIHNSGVDHSLVYAHRSVLHTVLRPDALQLYMVAAASCGLYNAPFMGDCIVGGTWDIIGVVFGVRTYVFGLG